MGDFACEVFEKKNWNNIIIWQYIRCVMYSASSIFLCRLLNAIIVGEKNACMDDPLRSVKKNLENHFAIALTDGCVVRSFSTELPSVYYSLRRKSTSVHRYYLAESTKQNFKLLKIDSSADRDIPSNDRLFAWTGKMFIRDRHD